jgi:hypothetical protein
MCMRTALVCLTLSAVAAGCTKDSGSGRESATQSVDACPVTTPNGVTARQDEAVPSSFGTLELSLGPFGLKRNGRVVVGPRGRDDQGRLPMKFGWWRGVPGRLVIDGRRLDSSAPPLEARVPSGYGDIGFQATSIYFPTPGCWEVTGRVGRASLTFVTIVELGESIRVSEAAPPKLWPGSTAVTVGSRPSRGPSS